MCLSTVATPVMYLSTSQIFPDRRIRQPGQLSSSCKQQPVVRTVFQQIQHLFAFFAAILQPPRRRKIFGEGKSPLNLLRWHTKVGGQVCYSSFGSLTRSPWLHLLISRKSLPWNLGNIENHKTVIRLMHCLGSWNIVYKYIFCQNPPFVASRDVTVHCRLWYPSMHFCGNIRWHWPWWMWLSRMCIFCLTSSSFKYINRIISREWAGGGPCDPWIIRSRYFWCFARPRCGWWFNFGVWWFNFWWIRIWLV